MITPEPLPLEDTTAEDQGLYPGDTGVLRLDTRRVLVRLLSGPSLDGERHSKLWPVLLQDEVIIRSRLSELFLELVLDRDQKVAFTRQANVGEIEAPALLRTAPLTLMDSLLLLYLRQQLTQAEARGERAVVETSDTLAYLQTYEPGANTDHAGFEKKVNASIEKMKKNNVLQKIRGSEDRYEISPALKLLFSAEEIQALTTIYRDLGQKAGARP